MRAFNSRISEFFLCNSWLEIYFDLRLLSSNIISNSPIINFWMNSWLKKRRQESIHGLYKYQWIYPWKYLNFILKSQYGICGKLWFLCFERSGPCGKFSISNFHRSDIGLKNVDLCNTLIIIILQLITWDETLIS